MEFLTSHVLLYFAVDTFMFICLYAWSNESCSNKFQENVCIFGMLSVTSGGIWKQSSLLIFRFYILIISIYVCMSSGERKKEKIGLGLRRVKRAKQPILLPAHHIKSILVGRPSDKTFMESSL